MSYHPYRRSIAKVLEANLQTESITFSEAEERLIQIGYDHAVAFTDVAYAIFKGFRQPPTNATLQPVLTVPFCQMVSIKWDLALAEALRDGNWMCLDNVVLGKIEVNIPDDDYFNRILDSFNPDGASLQ